jgi:hypothetical protein
MGVTFKFGDIILDLSKDGMFKLELKCAKIPKWFLFVVLMELKIV